MNKQRRKELEEAVRLLEDVYSTIESIMEQEQEAFDNMPEEVVLAIKELGYKTE